VIDLHSHILPWLDDGARDLGESVVMARSMARDGIQVVAATPHVRHDYPTTPEGMNEALQRVLTEISEAGIEIDVRGGGEISLEYLPLLDATTLARFGLGGNPRLLLIEYPYTGHAPSLADDCERLRLDGFVPVIAHPERSRHIQERPTDLTSVVEAGAVVQLTAASVDGRSGRACASTAHRLLRLELAHLIASDAHGSEVRESGLSRAARAIGGGGLANWLTSAVPAALLASEELPPRPSWSKRQRPRWRIRR
jgi:protein-tyrosine phosphatase